MGTARIQALTDGVYAIAMTILVLGLKVPRTAHNSTAVIKALLHLQLRLTDLTISFFLLAVFWTIHHRHFQAIKRVDATLIWLNMFSLLFVILIPFSTTLYGEYHTVVAGAVFFELNILILGLLKYRQWTYATNKNRLVDLELTRSDRIRGRMLNLVTPVVAVAAIATAFVTPNYSTMLFLLVPLLLAVVRRLLP